MIYPVCKVKKYKYEKKHFNEKLERIENMTKIIQV